MTKLFTLHNTIFCGVSAKECKTPVALKVQHESERDAGAGDSAPLPR